MTLLQMSLSGTMMILAVAVLRALALHRLPKSTFPALWAVAAARLLAPFSLPSAFSVYSLLGRLAPAAEMGMGRAPLAAPPPPFPPVDVAPSPPGASLGWGPALPTSPWTVLWMVGALACSAFFVTAYLKFRGEFQASLPVENAYLRRWFDGHRLSRAMEIRQSGRISAPLTYGLLHPVILMPKTTNWDDLDTLEYVLAHEYTHIRRLDAAFKLALTAALCVHWFNPAVWLMLLLANRDIELSCDEAVIRQFGEEAKPAYAMALIRMEEARGGPAPLYNHFSKNAIEERIVAIMKMRKSSFAAAVVAATMVFGVTVAFATSAADNGNPPFTNPGPVLGAVNHITEGTAVAADFLPYAPYGLVWDEGQQALFWNGERVRYFLDGTDLDGTGAMAVRLEYADMGLEGEIDLRAVRQQVKNPDGSFDPMGPLTGLEKYSREEFEERVFLDLSLEAETYLYQDLARQTAETKELLKLYAPYGLTHEYEIDPATDELKLSMEWQGKPVHSVYDEVLGVWIANSMRGLYLGPDAVDLEAVYQDGKLAGLRETQSHAATEISFVAEGDAVEAGTTFAERFEKYVSFGITYVEVEGASGRGNVYFNGQLVSRFIDLSPDGGAFTFSSSEPGGIVVKMLYDKNGDLSGIGTIQ